MGFTSDEDEHGDGRMPQLKATLVDIGIDYRDYGDGNEESRLIALWKPDSDVFGVQTSILSNTHVLEVVPDAKDIRVGGPERGFNIEVIGHVIMNGTLGYKAALWMAKLEDLGVKTPGDSGDLRELLGLKAVIKQLTYSEAKGRPKKDSEKAIWMPIEIITFPDRDVPATQEETQLAEAKTEVPPVVVPTLAEDILSNAEGRTEPEMVKWYEETHHYDGKSVVPLFMAISKALERGQMEKVVERYQVGIPVHIAEAERTGPADEKGASSPSGIAGEEK